MSYINSYGVVLLQLNLIILRKLVHIIFTNFYTHVSTLKIMKKYLNEYKKKSNVLLAKSIDLQVFKSNPHLRIIYAKKCKSKTCQVHSCKHHGYVHNPIQLYQGQQVLYSDYFYSYIDINKPFIHFELKEHIHNPTSQETPIENDYDYVPINRNLIKEEIETKFKR